MTYFEEALREMICEELDIPNIRHPISSDKGNNDYYVENERRIREAIRWFLKYSIWKWKREYQVTIDGKRVFPPDHSVDCDEPHRDST